MTKHLKVAGGVESAFATDQQEVISTLEQALEYARSGEFAANRVIVVMVKHDVDAFQHKTMHFCRATEGLGLLDVARVSLLQAMNVLP